MTLGNRLHAAFLDIGHQLGVLELVRRLNRERGMTIVLVLHDLNQAARYSSRMIALNGGRIVADDAPVDVLTPDMLGEYFAEHANIFIDTDAEFCFLTEEEMPAAIEAGAKAYPNYKWTGKCRHPTARSPELPQNNRGVGLRG